MSTPAPQPARSGAAGAYDLPHDTPNHFQARPASAERSHTDNDDEVLLSRLRAVIYGVSLAAIFVLITVFRYLDVLQPATRD